VVQAQLHRYVGPAEIRDRVVAVDTVAVDAAALLDGWLAGRDRSELAEPFTFVSPGHGVPRPGPKSRAG
jgi:hypothetical protein